MEKQWIMCGLHPVLSPEKSLFVSIIVVRTVLDSQDEIAIQVSSGGWVAWTGKPSGLPFQGPDRLRVARAREPGNFWVDRFPANRDIFG